MSRARPEVFSFLFPVCIALVPFVFVCCLASSLLIFPSFSFSGSAEPPERVEPNHRDICLVVLSRDRARYALEPTQSHGISTVHRSLWISLLYRERAARCPILRKRSIALHAYARVDRSRASCSPLLLRSIQSSIPRIRRSVRSILREETRVPLDRSPSRSASVLLPHLAGPSRRSLRLLAPSVCCCVQYGFCESAVPQTPLFLRLSSSLFSPSLLPLFFRRPHRHPDLTMTSLAIFEGASLSNYQLHPVQPDSSAHDATLLTFNGVVYS